MRKHTTLATTFAALALVGAVGAARADQTVKARLHAFNEVPAISSTGSGEFRATIHEDSVDWELSYEGLEGTVTTAAHRGHPRRPDLRQRAHQQAPRGRDPRPGAGGLEPLTSHPAPRQTPRGGGATTAFPGNCGLCSPATAR